MPAFCKLIIGPPGLVALDPYFVRPYLAFLFAVHLAVADRTGAVHCPYCLVAAFADPGFGLLAWAAFVVDWGFGQAHVPAPGLADLYLVGWECHPVDFVAGYVLYPFACGYFFLNYSGLFGLPDQHTPVLLLWVCCLTLPRIPTLRAGCPPVFSKRCRSA